jgi:hypothetical protein
MQQSQKQNSAPDATGAKEMLSLYKARPRFFSGVAVKEKHGVKPALSNRTWSRNSIPLLVFLPDVM